MSNPDGTQFLRMTHIYMGLINKFSEGWGMSCNKLISLIFAQKFHGAVWVRTKMEYKVPFLKMLKFFCQKHYLF